LRIRQYSWLEKQKRKWREIYLVLFISNSQ